MTELIKSFDNMSFDGQDDTNRFLFQCFQDAKSSMPVEPLNFIQSYPDHELKVTFEDIISNDNVDKLKLFGEQFEKLANSDAFTDYFTVLFNKKAYKCIKYLLSKMYIDETSFISIIQYSTDREGILMVLKENGIYELMDDYNKCIVNSISKD